MLRDACLYIPGRSGAGSGGIGTARTPGDTGIVCMRGVRPPSLVGVRTEK
jgi:hypothetical protein